MKTILEILQLSEAYLAQKRVKNPRRQAEEVLAIALSCKRIDLFLQFDRPLEQDEIERCRSCILRRGQGEPPQYIAGSLMFSGIEIQLSRDVLIPRPETEILVEVIAENLRSLDLKHKTLWDMCTGSGCIGIALKKKFPELKVILSDLSEDALKIAAKNAAINDVEVQLVQGDLFNPFLGECCDFFVCNPPYVSQGEYKLLPREVAAYEPRMALIAEDNGLEFYHRIAQQLPFHLAKSGKAWMEIGWKQKDKIFYLFQQEVWSKLAFSTDWAGKDRFFFLEKD